jgi:hypothetical protein
MSSLLPFELPVASPALPHLASSDGLRHPNWQTTHYLLPEVKS